MITAIATLALNAHTDQPKHRRDLDAHEKTTVTGTGATWETAVDACVIPDGAQVMHVMRG